MLTTLAAVRRMPDLNRVAIQPDAWVLDCIREATAAIKKYCKRDLEFKCYVEYYNGDDSPDLRVRQYPLWYANTVTSAGATLPATTLTVASTEGFPPGPAVGSSVLPVITVQVSNSAYTTLTYTHKTDTQFLGCSGGTGTVIAGYTVTTPSVWLNFGAYGGQGPSAFDDGNILPMGRQFFVPPDNGGPGLCDSGLITKVGPTSFGVLGFGFGSYGMYGGKLAATKRPSWGRGFGNIKLAYSAGFTEVPADLSNACKQLVAWMIRSNPSGAPISNESLGSYSYSVLAGSNDIPEIGAINRILARYRETTI